MTETNNLVWTYETECKVVNLLSELTLYILLAGYDFIHTDTNMNAGGVGF